MTNARFTHADRQRLERAEKRVELLEETVEILVDALNEGGITQSMDAFRNTRELMRMRAEDEGGNE